MQLILTGIAFGLIGTIAAGAISLGRRDINGHRISQLLLATATACAAAAAAAFLATGADRLVIFAPHALPALRLEINALSAVFFVIVNLVAFLCAIFAFRYVEKYERVYDAPSLGLGVAVFIFGMQSVLLSAGIAGFMVFWEIMSLSSFVLVMADRKEESRKAALLYFVMAQLGAAAILAGFMIVSSGDPWADFASVAASSRALPPWQVTLAFCLFFLGFGSKAGLVPLHIWLPEAHPQAPSHVSALMSSAMLKIAVYGFILVTTSLLPPLAAGFGLAVIGIGLLSAVFGILHAATEHDIKRAIAWHSIENLGLIFAMLGISMFAERNGLAVLSRIGLAAAVFHAINHALFKSGLFLSTGVIMSQMHTRDIEEMGGLAKRMPYFTVSICALTLSGAALPPFGTFYDEWMFVQGMIGSLSGTSPLVQAVLLVTVAVVAFCGGLAIFAMTKLFALPCLGQPRSEEAARMKEPPISMNGPVMFFAAAGLLSGIFAPNVLRSIGYPDILRADAAASIATPAGSVAPAAVFGLIAAVILCLVVARRFLGKNATRAYQTWDCGQPITPRMEYTATAFSAPIRFFFRNIVGIRKSVIVTPASESNSLVMNREMRMIGGSFWLSRVYEPLSRGLHRIGDLARRLQSGTIQMYLLFILVALGATLFLAI